MFLVQAIINNPQLKSLGKYEFKEPWSEEGVDDAPDVDVEAFLARIAAEAEESATNASKGG